MKRILLAASTVLAVFTSDAQLSYTFATATTPAYAANASPTTIHAAGTDDALSSAINIGFTFRYQCVDYTQIKVSSNGWLTFNTSITATNAFNNLATSSDRPIIAPLWDDLEVSTGGTVNYQLTGTAPNRVLTVEWRGMLWQYSATNPAISFQVKLYETTNVIDFVYIRISNPLDSPSASIGISGTTSGDYISVDGATTSSTTTEYDVNSKPANNRHYTFTPAASCSGTPTGGTAGASPSSITSCASMNTTLSLTGNSTGCGITYQWQSSPNNVTWTNISGATSSTYTTAVGVNTYFRCVIGCTISGASSNSSSVLVSVTVSAPANDDPCSATTLSVNASCTYATYTNNCATATTAGSPPAPGCASYSGGDVWFNFTVPPGGRVIMDSNTGVILDGGAAIYTGTCGALTLVACDDDNSTNGAMPYLDVSGLTPGTTAFIRFWEYSNDNNGTFGICLTDPCAGSYCSGTPTGGTASSTLTSANCTSNSATLSLTGTSTGCGILYQWQSSPDNITWTNISGATSATLTTSVTTTLYYRCLISCAISGLSSPSTSVYITFSGAIPANDLPCNAEALTLAVSAYGDNGCSGNTSEPATPGCWTGGTVNTVWYTFVPTSTSVKIKTVPVSSATTLQNTQIAVFSGSCGSLTMVSGACNDNAPSCGSYTQINSELTVTGLTAGTTYYVAVDGANGLTGQFEILVIDGSSSFPLVPGQDCSQAFTVCNATTTIGNPGYQVIGGQCDYDGSANCTSGEANSIWYQINIGSAGSLSFDIIPNDYGNPNPIMGQVNPGYSTTGDETDYDWVLWKISGTGATTCAAITSSGGSSVAACNFNGYGVTGTSTSGNAPATYGTGFDGAYETAPTVASGEVYMLVIQNYSNSTSGFSLVFPTGTPASFPATTTLNWSAGAGTTSWTTPANWGGCGSPTCSVDALVTAASALQPVLPAGTYNVRDLTINPGSVLTLQNGAVLRVCGNLTNNGSLVCQTGSTIEFVGTGTQNVSGSLTGSDAFYHFRVNKASGTVVLNNNIDIKGNFTTVNLTSVLNTNSMYITLSGHFSNFGGNTTYTNTGTTGTLELNGSAAQNYNQGSSTLDLNFVLMNHTGPGVTLQTDMNIKTTTGTLTLTLGKIVTTTAFQVYCKNTTTTAVTNGNASSFVDGYLRRNISGTGAYNFPVGNAAKGYQRATINFTTATTTINNLRANFTSWASVPGPLGVTDCTVPYNLPFLDNGYWTINAFNAGGTQITGDGIYTCTLWPGAGSYTNATTANEWTVAKDPTNTLTWSITGTCNLASTVSQVIRDAMTGFSGFAIEQSTTTLPVELLSFTGKVVNKDHLLEWVTASEVNNEWFILEQSVDGNNYNEIYRTHGKMLSAGNTYYRYTNEYPEPGANYYRLKQVDKDGAYAYSNVVILNSTYNQVTMENIFPNPTNGNIQFELITNETTAFDVEVYDVAGKLVMQKTHTQEAGRFTVHMEMSRLGSGVYTLRVQQRNGVFRSINRIVKNG